MGKEKVEQVSKIIAEIAGDDYDNAPYHKKLTYRARARLTIEVMEKWKEVQNGANKN